MSGAVKSNVFGSSGTVAAAAGGLKWESVVTASTVTVESNRGYFVNTTSNACTVTLPASPSVGDQVILLDYARTWDTNAVTIDSNGNDFQGDPDTYTVDYDTEGQGINIVFSGSTNGWIPNSDIANAFDHTAPPTQRAIFAYGDSTANDDFVSLKNLVNSSGVVAADVTGVGTARGALGAAGYGGDKAIFAYGTTASVSSLSNLVNNAGVVAADVSGVGTARSFPGSANYGGDKAIFAYGYTGSGRTAVSNLISNLGVVASDVSGVGIVRTGPSAASYGSTGQAIFAFGANDAGDMISISNLVTNLGVISSDITGVGTERYQMAAASYGGDKAIYAFGYLQGSSARVNTKNLVSNSGVVASDASGVGTARRMLAAAGYGGDKALFAYGQISGALSSLKNLVSNSGVVASDVTGVGTARLSIAAAGYSSSA
jgi:hypothetical protein